MTQAVPGGAPRVLHIAVVDDNTLYRDWLGVAGNLPAHHHVVLRSANAQDLVAALPHLPDHRCDVVVLDLRIVPLSAPDPVYGGPAVEPAVQGRPAIDLIHAESDKAVAAGNLLGRPAILVHTQESAPRIHLECLLAGACGVVAKGETLAHLGEAIDIAAEGGLVVSPALAGLLEQLAQQKHYDLTDAQAGILTLAGHGLTRHQIARQMQISESTVDKHLRAIRDRFGDTANLTDIADQFGLRDLAPPLPESRTHHRLRDLAARIRRTH